MAANVLVGFDWHTFVILPILIFCARITDVTIGTIRIIFVSRGKRHLAPFLGFVEVFIWVSVIAQIVGAEHNLIAYLAYAGGFSVGNFVGMTIEDKLALGTFVIRAILPKGTTGLIEELRSKGYGVTSAEAEGSHGSVKLVYTIVQRKELPNVAKIIERSYPKAFFTVEELRSVAGGIFPPAYSSRPLIFGRKSK